MSYDDDTGAEPEQTTALEDLRERVKATLASGQQISFRSALVADRLLTLGQLREWYGDTPEGMNKAEAVEWAAQQILHNDYEPADFEQVVTADDLPF